MTMTKAKATVVVHLSDIHFGMDRDGASAHYFVQKTTAPDPHHLANLIVGDGQLAIQKPDIVIISGDTVWSAQPSEYQVAAKCFALLRERWPQAAFAITPGNHDVDRGAKRNSERQSAYVRFVRSFYGAVDFAKYFPFYSSDDRHSIVGIFSKGDLLVVTVNSAACLQKNGTPVFVAQSILDRIADHITKRHGHKHQLRAFVMHHHLLPFVEQAWGRHVSLNSPPDAPDATIVANSGRLQSWLAANGFSILLHGHKHEDVRGFVSFVGRAPAPIQSE